MGTSGRGRGAKGGGWGGQEGAKGVRGGERSKLGWIRIPSNQGEIAELFLAGCFGNKELVAGLRLKANRLN